MDMNTPFDYGYSLNCTIPTYLATDSSQTSCSDSPTNV